MLITKTQGELIMKNNDLSQGTETLTGFIPKGIFSPRTYNQLQDRGIFTWEKLLSYRKEGLLKLTQLDVAAIKEIEDTLTKDGFSLKQ